MGPDLTNQYIDDTFGGLLHMNGQSLPSTAWNTVYDGIGNESSLKIGLDGAGAKVSGVLTVGEVTYPNTEGDVGDILYHRTPGNIGRLSKLSSSSLADVTRNPEDTDYINPSKITVKKSGLVSNVLTSPVDENYNSSTTIYISYNGSKSMGEYSIRSGHWESVSLKNDSNISNSSNPKLALCSIDLLVDDNNFETDSDQQVTFYIGSSGDDSNDYKNLTPILSIFAGSGRSVFGGCQFYAPIRFGSANSTSQFLITSNTNPTSPNQSWTVRIRLIGYTG